MNHSGIPDFKLLPWKFLNRFSIFKGNNLHNSEDEEIGFYNVYINEFTGEYGHEVILHGSGRVIISWENNVFYAQEQKILRYIAYWKDYAWRKLRVLRNIPDIDIKMDGSGRFVSAVNLKFELVTGAQFYLGYAFRG